jgi:hypothetical protein
MTYIPSSLTANSSIYPQAPEREVKYSESGLKIAQDTYTEVEEMDSPYKFGGAAIRKGFYDISRDESTTEDEKFLANLGTNIIQSAYHAHKEKTIGSVALQTITTGTSGPVGVVTARMTLDAAEKAGGSLEKTNVYRKGFTEMTRTEKTTTNEKALAQLGRNVLSSDLSMFDRAKVGKHLLEEISEDPTGSMGEVIAESMSGAMDKVSPESRKKLVLTGLQSITDNPEATDSDLQLTKSILDAGEKNDYTPDAVKSAIKTSIEVPGQQAAGVNTQPSEGVVVTKNRVIIGGVSLNKKHHTRL